MSSRKRRLPQKEPFNNRSEVFEDGTGAKGNLVDDKRDEKESLPCGPHTIREETDEDQAKRQRILARTRNKFKNEFIIRDVVGDGGFGIVFEVERKADFPPPPVFALKRIYVKPDEEVMSKALKEATNLKKLNSHEGIVKYIDSWEDRPEVGEQVAEDREIFLKFEQKKKNKVFAYTANSWFIYILMQLCRQSLANWLQQNPEDRSIRTRDLPAMKKWFIDIVSAVGFIHDNKLIHRDLKPENILLTNDSCVKITDLGTAMDQKQLQGKECTLSVSAGSNILTELYASPEQLSRMFTEVKTKSDVFTLGLIFAEQCVVMNEDEKKKEFRKIRCGNTKEVSGIDDDTAEFINHLTNEDRNKRPSCLQILDHDYLAN